MKTQYRKMCTVISVTYTMDREEKIQSYENKFVLISYINSAFLFTSLIIK